MLIKCVFSYSRCVSALLAAGQDAFALFGSVNIDIYSMVGCAGKIAI